ncbi:hypothetical protein TNCV_204581, partial [Trichonephila clavipes]
FLDILLPWRQGGASGGRLNRRSAGRRRSRPKSIWDREHRLFLHPQFVGKQAGSFLSSPADHDARREAVQNGPIVFSTSAKQNARMQSCCPGCRWRVFRHSSVNCRIEVSPLIGA